MIIHRKILEEEAILSRNVSKRLIDEKKQTRQTFHNSNKSSLRECNPGVQHTNIYRQTEGTNEKFIKFPCAQKYKQIVCEPNATGKQLMEDSPKIISLHDVIADDGVDS